MSQSNCVIREKEGRRKHGMSSVFFPLKEMYVCIQKLGFLIDNDGIIKTPCGA